MLGYLGRRAVCYFCLVTLSACKSSTLEDTRRTPVSGGSYDAMTLPITGCAQETTDWCWAASAQTIMQFHQHNVPQCEQAKDEFADKTCCNQPTPQVCIDAAWPSFGRYRFDSTVVRTPLSFPAIVGQIKARRPFAFTWNWAGGGAHMMVLIGYQIKDGHESVVIFDPLPPNVGTTKTIPYDAYVQVRGDHTHSRDYVDVVPRSK